MLTHAVWRTSCVPSHSERVRELEEEVARLTALNARLLRDAKAFHDEQAQMAEQLRLARERVAKLEALEVWPWL